MDFIESAQNPKFKTWLSLCDSRGIKKAGLALLSGRKLVEEFLRSTPGAARQLLVSHKVRDDLPASLQRFDLAGPLFRELDVLGTDAPLLVVAVPELPAWKPQPPHGLELVVPVSDPGNLGAILRSAEAFGASRVILTREASHPFLPRALRASSGAAFRLPLVQAGPLSDFTEIPGFCLDMKGESVHGFAWPLNLHLILGEEGRGIPKDWRANRLSIPMNAQSESLNVVVAASIAMFSYRVARGK
jgi:TrmH family RNA methyltransferase